MPTAATTRRRTTKAKPAPEPEDLEELTDDADLPEDDDLEEEAPAPKRRTAAKVPAQRKAAAEAETFGTAWLVEHVNDTLDTEYDAKTMRVKLRAITAAGILDREDSSRYTFSGPTDRNVLKILKWLRENAKAEAAEAKPAATTRKAAAPAAKRGRPRKAAAPVEEDDDLGDDIDDL